LTRSSDQTKLGLTTFWSCKLRILMVGLNNWFRRFFVVTSR